MKKKLKIAMVSSYDLSYTGGVGEHLFFLSRELKKRGHRVHIYGPTRNLYPYENYHAISKSIDILSLGGHSLGFMANVDQGNNAILKMDKKNYDLVHFHDPYVPFVNSEIIKNVKAPKVASFH